MEADTGIGQCFEDTFGIIAFAASAIEDRIVLHIVLAAGQSGTAEGRSQRGIITGIQKGGACSDHGLVVAGIFGVHLIDRQQMGITGRCNVKAMAAPAAIAGLHAQQRFAADGANEKGRLGLHNILL